MTNHSIPSLWVIGWERGGRKREGPSFHFPFSNKQVTSQRVPFLFVPHDGLNRWREWGGVNERESPHLHLFYPVETLLRPNRAVPSGFIVVNRARSNFKLQHHTIVVSRCYFQFTPCRTCRKPTDEVALSWELTPFREIGREPGPFHGHATLPGRPMTGHPFI